MLVMNKQNGSFSNSLRQWPYKWPLLALALCLPLAGCAKQSLTSGSTNPAALNGGPAPIDDSAKKASFNPFAEDFNAEQPKRLEVIKNPTLAQVMKLGTLPEMSMGRADAPVTIIKYASLTCPYCRKFQKEVFPVLKRDYIDRGKVRFIIREFPIGRQSGLATIAWRCAGRKNFFKLYDEFLFNQRRWVSQQVRAEPILKIASKLGMTRAKFDSCRQNQGMISGLKWIKDRGRKLGVIGTPNFFINGKLVKRRIGVSELRNIIDPLLSNRVAAGSRQLPR